MTSLEKELSPRSSSSGTTGPNNRHLLAFAALTGCLALAAGCRAGPPNTFTFTADLPPGFAYIAIAEYEPAKGETCRVPDRRKTGSGFNLKWREKYDPISKIDIRKTVEGCPLAIRRVSLEIKSAYGKDWSDISGDRAVVAIHPELEARYKGRFDNRGESTFYGQCQWLFRTAGKPRILRKILDCKETDAQGAPVPGRPFAAYTHDQLPGKTVKMKIRLAKEEKPGWGDTWVKVPNGWKRCMGKGYEDERVYCHGNYTDFSVFRMPDGRVCSIYPGCTE